MGYTLPSTLRAVANIISVTSVLVIIGVVGRNYVGDSAASEPAQASIRSRLSAVGTHISVPDVDFSKHRETIVAVLSVECGLGSVASDLYREAVNLSRNGDIGMVTVFLEPGDEGKRYLDNLGLPSSEIKQAELSAIPVQRAPTFMVVDFRGVVVEYPWVGRHMDSSSRISRKAKAEASHVVQPAEVPIAIADRTVQILDVRPRDQFQKAHLTDAVNIPLDELRARVIHEFSVDAALLVMCGRCDICESGDDEQRLTNLCTKAFKALKVAGFNDIRMLRRDPSDLSRGVVAGR